MAENLALDRSVAHCARGGNVRWLAQVAGRHADASSSWDIGGGLWGAGGVVIAGASGSY